MILVDANLLVYAHVESLPQHAAARQWLDEQLSGSGRVGLPWPSLLAFARLVSNPRVFERPLTVADAWKQVERWLNAASAWIPLPSAQHSQILAEILAAGVVHRATLLPDAHLAALALEHGLVLCSADSDFARFPSLRWQNPLQPEG